MMGVEITRVQGLYRDKIAIQWSLTSVDSSRASGVLFDVQVSGTGTDPWDTIAENVDNVIYINTFEDAADNLTEENLLTLSKERWYRVKAYLSDGEILVSDPVDNYGTHASSYGHSKSLGVSADRNANHPNPQTIFSPKQGTKRRLVLIQRAIQRRRAIALEKYNGVDVAILKRRHYGERCSTCFDRASGMIMLSRCDECYGTGWEGGFYPSIKSVARFVEGTLNTQKDRSGNTEIRQSQLELLDFPRLEKDDIIVELDSGRRWVVAQESDEKHIRRRRLYQSFICNELNRDAVQYCIDINTEQLEGVLLYETQQ